MGAEKKKFQECPIFVDLRDRSGMMQVVFDEPVIGSEGTSKAGTSRKRVLWLLSSARYRSVPQPSMRT